MTKRAYVLYLNDIIESIEKIQRYTRDLNLESFSANQLAIDAVVRNLEIIGEAAKNIPSKVKSLHKEVPWKEMAGMRDKVIHEYFGVDLKIVWKTIKGPIPEIKEHLGKML